MKSSVVVKGSAALFIFASAVSAVAEQYVPHIYSVPAPYSHMTIEGAGSNGMMTGTIFGPGTIHAATLTHQGFRDLNAVGGADSYIRD